LGWTVNSVGYAGKELLYMQVLQVYLVLAYEKLS
jgi:hypothetical protein